MTAFTIFRGYRSPIVLIILPPPNNVHVRPIAVVAHMSIENHTLSRSNFRPLHLFFHSNHEILEFAVASQALFIVELKREPIILLELQ